MVQQLSIEQLTTDKFTFGFRCKFFSTHFPFLIHCLWSSQSLEFHPNVLLSLLPRAFLKTLLLIALQRIVFLFLKTTLVTSGAVPNLISLWGKMSSLTSLEDLAIPLTLHLSSLASHFLCLASLFRDVYLKMSVEDLPVKVLFLEALWKNGPFLFKTMFSNLQPNTDCQETFS